MRPIDADRLLEDIAAAEEHGGMGAIVSGTLRRYVLRQPTLTQPNGWISVKDSLPEPGERVLATDGTFVGEAYRTSANSWCRHTGFPWRDGVTGRTVSFWMPLPEPPAGESDA